MQSVPAYPTDTRTPYEQFVDGDLSPYLFFNIVSGDMYEHDMASQEAQAAYNNVKSQLEHVMSVLEATLAASEFNEYRDKLARRGYTYQSVKPHARRNIAVTKLLGLQKRITAVDPELWAAIEACITYTNIDGGARIGHAKKEEANSGAPEGTHR